MNSAQDLIDRQIDYYQARAAEYDQWFFRHGRYDRGAALNRQWFREIDELRSALRLAGPGGDVLEIACGTGLWTQVLLDHATGLTAVDASEEMIELCRARNPGDKAVYHRADLFAWNPDRRYDFVFFGFWLFHVPEDRFEAFWDLVGRCLKPTGRVCFIDSLRNVASTAMDHVLPDPDTSVLTRRLNDGREYTICKTFHQPAGLRTRLAKLGWDVRVWSTESFFLFGLGSRKSPDGSPE